MMTTQEEDMIWYVAEDMEVWWGRIVVNGAVLLDIFNGCLVCNSRKVWGTREPKANCAKQG